MTVRLSSWPPTPAGPGAVPGEVTDNWPLAPQGQRIWVESDGNQAPDFAPEPGPDPVGAEPAADSQRTLDLPPIDFPDDTGLDDTASLPAQPVAPEPMAVGAPEWVRRPPLPKPDTSTIKRATPHPKWPPLHPDTTLWDAAGSDTGADPEARHRTLRRTDADHKPGGEVGHWHTAAVLTATAVTVGFITGIGVSIGLQYQAGQKYEAADHMLATIRAEQDQLTADRADLDQRQAAVDQQAADLARHQQGLAVSDGYGTRDSVELDDRSAASDIPTPAPDPTPSLGRHTATDSTAGDPGQVPTPALVTPAPGPTTVTTPRHMATPPSVTQLAPDTPDTTGTSGIAGTARQVSAALAAGYRHGQDAGVFFANCDEVIAAGVAPLRAGEPGYRPALDPDGDGIACVW